MRGLQWAEQKKKSGTLKEPAVIEYTHSFLKTKSQKPYDSVRAAFIEEVPIYPGVGFNDKTHIQLCIINPDCIKGFFLPRSKKR